MHALIVEDESLSAKHLCTLLDGMTDIEVIGQLDSIEDTVQWFQTHDEPDILFLDIHLADGSAFEIFNQIDVRCPIIFTTAYDEYALSAFKVNSISYLLKPIKEEDVSKAIKKLHQLQGERLMSMRELTQWMKSQSGAYKSHILVSIKSNKLVPLKVDDIAYIQIEDSLVKAHTFSNQVFYMDQILDELTNSLDPRMFYRANRQYIINRKAVKDIDQWFQSRLSINLTVPISEKILISRAKVAEFKTWVTGEA